MIKTKNKILAMLLVVSLLIGALPVTVFAAPASDIPENMLDNSILRALEYTGYDVQKQKDNGTLYQYGYYSTRLENNAPEILSDIHYGYSMSGKETVADSSTVTGRAPDISRFEKNGLCCASFVTYFLCNYLPNIEGADTQFILDAVNATGTNTQAVPTWRTALDNLTAQGKIDKVGTSASSAVYSRMVPGDIIMFGNDSDRNVHIAIYAGTYSGRHYIIHVGNDRGPEISTVENMGNSVNGNKASYPNAFYHLPDEIFMEDGNIEIYKTDEDGKALAGAVFVATNTKTGKAYRIGPTNSSGYAKSESPIPFGTYKIIETVFPTNYQAGDVSEWTRTLDKDTPNATITIRAVNEIIPGTVKIIKTSEDGKVDGLAFRVQGNGIDQTVVTKDGGQIQVEDLKPGIYTITEQVYDKYEPQETRRVTVVSGQTSTVTFNNVLKRGDLEVVKTSEDNFVEGMKFHLYGTSLSGIPVDEYAVTDASGKAVFEDVLISGDTPYIIEEVDTDIKYVIPDSQSVRIEWNKVTEKSFHNALKKWQLTVTKSDSETGNAQGDASLSGAIYGIYKGDQLVDSYTTDANGQFTTDYYVCGDDWVLREISASEGYLLNTESVHIGAEAKLYTAEYNLAAPIDSLEDVIKGKIALIKHCDDGTTQVETPEAGAEFEIFLAAAGSYEGAKESERDILTCDENGFAESKLLPYGVYTVKQVKGWEGKELLPAFNVYINEDGFVHRFLINNAIFESLIEIVKKDAETGKVIPAAGIGFKVRSADTGAYISQHINYPTPVDIDTFYTDITGKLMLPQALPYGNYELIEQNTAYGYVLDSSPVPFTVDGSQTVVTVEKQNMPQKGTITVTKNGEILSSVAESNGVYQPVYSDSGLEDAIYDVYAQEDIVTPDGTLRAEKDALVATIKTGADGVGKSIPLYLGSYRVVERRAPYAMVLNTEPRYVELTYAGENVEITNTDLSFYNERQKAQISLTKVLEQDETFGIGQNSEILSVQFGLFAAEDFVAADGSVIPADGLMEIAGCDENGSVMFQTDLPVGAKAYVKELATDGHYHLSDEKYPVIFEYAGQDKALVNINVNDGKPIENDLIYGTIKGLKIDRETDETIPGALFGLFAADETDFSAENALLTAESQSDGLFTFENVPYGDWIIKELRPAEGFLPNEEVYHVKVAEDEEVIEITVSNDRIPEIGTQASIEGAKEANATEVFTLEDTVFYEHLVPGREYVLKGILMDKTTGEPLFIDGQEVRSELTFIPDEPSGQAVVSFTFDSKFIKEDTDIVVFETLYLDEQELAVHADINDEGQTVKIRVPQIGTQATVDGKKEVVSDSEIVIDDMVSYENLTPGKEYTVKGILMNKLTGQPLLIDSKTVEAEVTFTPEESSGEIKVIFTFDGSSIVTGTEIVVFESLYRDGVEIATHADIEDEEQTVKVTPPEADIPKTGDDNNFGFWIGLGMVAAGGVIAGLIMYFKRKKDDGNV